MYNRSLFERDEGGRIEMQPCTVEQLRPVCVCSCWPARPLPSYHACAQLDRPVSCCSNSWLDLVLFFKTFLFLFFSFLYVCLCFGGKFHGHKFSFCFSVKQAVLTWNISPVLPEVFSFFQPFQFTQCLGENNFLAGFADNVLVALKKQNPSKHKKRKQTIRRPPPGFQPEVQQRSSLPVPVRFFSFRIFLLRQLIQAIFGSEFRVALGRLCQQQMNRGQKSPPE